MTSTDKKLAEVIQRVFRIKLTDPGGGNSDLLFLEPLAVELVGEGGEPPFAVTPALLERALFARLSTSVEELPQQWQHDPEAAPFPWLLSSYNRCDTETRKTRSRDEAFAVQVSECLSNCFDLCISYSGLLLNPEMAGMFPQPNANEQRGPLQLFDAMVGTGAFAELSNQFGGGLPNGFITHFGQKLENEGLSEILTPILTQLPNLIKNISPLGEIHKPLSVLCGIAQSKPCALVLVGHDKWRPDFTRKKTIISSPKKFHGRAFEDESVLGPFFQCAALPDDPPTVVGPNGIPMVMNFRSDGNPYGRLPDVRVACFSDLDKKRQVDLESSYGTIRNLTGTVREGLFQTLFTMLKHGGEIREGVVNWLSSYCDRNDGRSKMRIDPRKCASHGGAVNVSSIAARLSAPFCDPSSLKFQKINPDYVRSVNCRLNVTEVTRISATDDEVVSNNLSESEEPSDAFGFICECFFLTARAMHLGYVKCAAEHTSLARDLQDRQKQFNEIESHRDSWAASIPGGPSQFQMQQFERRISEMKNELEQAKQNYAMFDATLLDPVVLGETCRFYRLVAVWLRWVAEGQGAGVQGANSVKRDATAMDATDMDTGNTGSIQSSTTPLITGGSLLQTPVPKAFASLPEHLLDDLCEFLLYVQRFARRGPGRATIDAELSVCLDDFVNLFVLLLGSPTYVKNPYLRAKSVEILRGWLPGDPTDTRYEYVPRWANLFEGGNSLATKSLVPSLLRLYVDIEFTGGANQFYDKFNIRHQIGEMCEYLWRIEAHQNEWSLLALNDSVFYVRFLNMLINDAIWLLDESMKKLPELREFQALLNVQEQWMQRTPQDRQERESANRQNERALRSDLTLAKVHVGMMGYTSVSIASPFLRPEMVERVAAMLNYFLLYLAGPERKTLKFADKEKMKELAWDPPEMLGQIVTLYLNLFDADAEGAFVNAIVADGRSYRHEVLVEAALILKQLGTKSVGEISKFELLAEKCRVTHLAAEEEEADLGDIPDEYIDPIMCTLMTDPVLLPSGDNMDRANITRHLLTDEINPFTRQPLKVEDLVDNEKLKKEIENWIAERKRAARE
jgi:ubiquitin conjugation factor E4 B